MEKTVIMGLAFFIDNPIESLNEGGVWINLIVNLLSDCLFKKEYSCTIERKTRSIYLKKSTLVLTFE